MSEIKAAFFDIDNTVYDHFNHCYDASAIKAIKQLKKNGVKVFIASARPYYSLKLFGVFDLGIKWDGYITSCGANAKVGRHFTRRLKLNKKVVRTLVESVTKRNLTMEIIGCYDVHLIAPKTRLANKYYEDFKEAPTKVYPYKGGYASTLLLFAPKEMDEELSKENPSLIFYRFHECAIDILPEKREKGRAIDEILGYCGLNKDNAIAFGDDVQDISMAASCKYFVAVGNAKKEVKEKATFISSSVNENGVRDGLKHYGLI